MSSRGGGMNMQGYRGRGRGGGGGGRGAGGGRGGSFRGGRGGHSGGPRPTQSDEPCKNFLTKGECKFGESCSFQHNIRLHKEFVATGKQHESVRAIALYPPQSMILYSEGSKVKCLNESLTVISELPLDGPVTAMLVVGHFLFIAYEAVAPGLTALPVGFIKVYYLASSPPQELFLRSPGQPYAHRGEIIGLDAAPMGTDDSVPPVLFSASMDSTIRMWQFAPASGSWESRVLEGHVRGVTSIVWCAAVGRLYTGSVDRTIKVWNPADGACTHTILPPASGAGVVPAGPGGVLAAAARGAVAVAPPPVGGGNGHNSEILGLAELHYLDTAFLVSGALDGSIRVWQLTGNPDAPRLIEAAKVPPDEKHRLLYVGAMDLEGAPGNPVVIVAQRDGSVVVRDVNGGMVVAATLSGHRNAGHTAEVRCILPGPSDYFFSGGDDGKFCVWQAVVPVESGGTDGAAAAPPGA